MERVQKVRLERSVEKDHGGLSVLHEELDLTLRLKGQVRRKISEFCASGPEALRKMDFEESS